MNPTYYFAVATEMINALNSDDSESVALARVMRTGCKALGELLKDLDSNGDLRWVLDHLAEVRRTSDFISIQKAEAKTALLEVFLREEIDALRKLGVSPQVVAYIQTQVRVLLKDLADEPPHWEKVYGDLKLLRDRVCSMSYDLEKTSDKKTAARRVLDCVSGAGLLGFNGSTDVVTTFGLAPWMSVLSGAAGTRLLFKGAGLG